MSRYRVDLAQDEVEGKSGVPADEEIRRLKGELRRIAIRMAEMEPADEESDEHRRLKKRYHEIQARLRELAGGDAAPCGAREDFSFEDFAEQSGLENWLASKGLDQEPTRKGVDLSEGEDRSEEGRPFFGPEEFFRKAAEEDADLPDHMREDAELQHELRGQSHEEHFGEDPEDSLSDDEMWAEYRRTIGEGA